MINERQVLQKVMRQ